MYDIIGDIHGHAGPLKQLLDRLGYRETNGVWRHSHRKALFLGDYIDRGPEQVEVVRVVRAMVDAGAALAIMGNHEFNAVAWTTPHPSHPGEHLRPHTAKNRHQHHAFLEQVGEGSPLHQEVIDWCRTLPLYLDLPELRAVHACWHPVHITTLSRELDDRQRVPADAWVRAATEGNALFDAVETTLKGQEIELPDGAGFHDKDGHHRRHVRTRWWQSTPATYRSVALIPDSARATVPDQPLPDGLLPGYQGDKPVFVGHYWLSGTPAPLTGHVACLDYSIAARHGGRLAAYRWDGRHPLHAGAFEWVAHD
ncbi:MAG: metallophosphoesterase [Alcanivorax sp.]|nr:metallophosphoesterase [Alcanivorax sp.]